MKNLPTAKELFDKMLSENEETTSTEMMIEFAKLHVEAALKEASKSKRIDLYVRPDVKGTKYKLVEPGEKYDIFETRQMWKINKEAILNSYPLEKIK